MLEAVLDAGVTLIDTADAYCLDERDVGHNERLIASALRAGAATDRRHRRDQGGRGASGRTVGHRRQPRASSRRLRRSLRALGVERIDLYQLHAPDPRVPFAESVGAMAELQRQGKVRWIGLSNVSVERIEEAGVDRHRHHVQNRLNPFFRESLSGGVVRYCAEQGIGFLAYSPTGGGAAQSQASHPSRSRLR